ncbi:MAG: hypothetical protein II773_02490, partial [Oscillospiraceae bacterium]|nr:hypothetical protein [Oscillospiraceae bacterium]
MSNQTSIYNEKKIAYYESTYKIGMWGKPQEVNLTVTAQHIYGLGYVMEQKGTQEDDPVYTRFSCSLGEITKVYINENVKNSPLYIQCDTDIKGVIDRKRIIIPCLKNAAMIVDELTRAKEQYDEKMRKSKERAKALKREELEAEKRRLAEEAAEKAALDKETESERKAIENELPDIPDIHDIGISKNEPLPEIETVSSVRKDKAADSTDEEKMEKYARLRRMADLDFELEITKKSSSTQASAKPDPADVLDKPLVKAEADPADILDKPLVKAEADIKDLPDKPAATEKSEKPAKTKFSLNDLVNLNNSIDVDVLPYLGAPEHKEYSDIADIITDPLPKLAPRPSRLQKTELSEAADTDKLITEEEKQPEEAISEIESVTGAEAAVEEAADEEKAEEAAAEEVTEESVTEEAAEETEEETAAEEAADETEEEAAAEETAEETEEEAAAGETAEETEEETAAEEAAEETEEEAAAEEAAEETEEETVTEEAAAFSS